MVRARFVSALCVATFAYSLPESAASRSGYFIISPVHKGLASEARSTFPTGVGLVSEAALQETDLTCPFIAVLFYFS